LRATTVAGVKNAVRYVTSYFQCDAESQAPQAAKANVV